LASRSAVAEFSTHGNQSPHTSAGEFVGFNKENVWVRRS
jgi:hypothetical protein